ncbi:hypothetical protein ACNKHW_12765 [Shigella flexneri]
MQNLMTENQPFKNYYDKPLILCHFPPFQAQCAAVKKMTKNRRLVSVGYFFALKTDHSYQEAGLRTRIGGYLLKIDSCCR